VVKIFKPGEWSQFDNITLTAGQNLIKGRLASAVNGGTIEIHTGSSSGNLIGTITVPNTGNIDSYTNDVCATIQPQSGTFSLYFVYKGGVDGGCNLDWVQFTAATVATIKIHEEDFTGKSSDPYITAGSLNNNISNNWLEYSGIQFNGETKFKAFVSSCSGGGKIEIRTGSPTDKFLVTAVTCSPGYLNGVYLNVGKI